MIDWYVATGEWRERAGGYAIQGAGAALVREVRGDYENVVGLPLATLLDLCPELLDLTAGSGYEMRGEGVGGGTPPPHRGEGREGGSAPLSRRGIFPCK